MGAQMGLINYLDPDTYKFYKLVTKPLDEENFYGCEQAGLQGFLKLLSSHANKVGWQRQDPNNWGILWIPDDIAVPNGPRKNLLDSYGEISIEKCRQWEATYVGTPTRAAQDSALLFTLLMKSMTQDAKNRVNTQEKVFTINGKKDEAGVTLLRIIISVSHLDSKATVSSIRTQLSYMDRYIQDVGGDVIKFNAHVTGLLEKLASYGETSNELLTMLFKAYKCVKDDAFVTYIKDKESNWEDLDGVDYTPEQLMNYAESKFKILVAKGEWQAQSEEQKSLLALQTELKQVHKELREAKKKRDKVVVKANQSSYKAKKPGGKSLPGWLYYHRAPSKQALKEPRQFDGKDFYYCCKETGGACKGKWHTKKPSVCAKEKQPVKQEVPEAKPMSQTYKDLLELSAKQAAAMQKLRAANKSMKDKKPAAKASQAVHWAGKVESDVESV